MSPLPVATLTFDQPETQDREGSTQPSDPQLLSLWDWYSNQQGWSLSLPPLPTFGSFVWAASVQPNAALGPGNVCLSGNLIKSIGGCSLAVYDSGRIETHQDVQVQTGQKEASKQIVYLRMMLDQNTGDTKSASKLPSLHEECEVATVAAMLA